MNVADRLRRLRPQRKTPGLLRSNPRDFPNVAVYERAGPVYPVYTVVFSNYEWEGLDRAVAAVFMVAGLASWFPWTIQIGANIAGWTGAGVVVAGIAFLFWWLAQPWKYKRAIELDFAADQVRVYRNGRLKKILPLQNYNTLTTEEHADAPLVRQRKQESTNIRDQIRLRPAEKQVCLVYHYGGGASEPLFCRMEWPYRGSLREVHYAFEWTRALMVENVKAQPRPGTMKDINPPL